MTFTENEKVLVDYNSSCIEKPWSVVLVAYKVIDFKKLDDLKPDDKISPSTDPKDCPLATEWPSGELKFFSEHGASIGDFKKTLADLNYAIFLTKSINIQKLGVRGGQTASIDFYYDDFPLNPQNLYAGNVFIFGGSFVEDKLFDISKLKDNDLSTALIERNKDGKYEIERFFKMLEADNVDGNSLKNNSLLYAGYIDSMTVNLNEDERVSTISSRDHVGLMLDKNITSKDFKELAKVMKEPIEKIVAEILKYSEVCSGMYTHYIGIEANKIKLSLTEIEKFNQNDNPKTRIKADMSYWDILYEITGQLGLNVELYYETLNKNDSWTDYVCEPRIKISTPEVNFGYKTADEQDVDSIKKKYENKEFFYLSSKSSVNKSFFDNFGTRPICYIGYDAVSLELNHEMNSVAPVVCVISVDQNGLWNSKDKKVQRVEGWSPQSIYDKNGKLLTDDKYKVKCNKLSKLGLKWNPKEYVEIFIPGLDAAQCKETADRILNQMNLGQYKMSLETFRSYYLNAADNTKLTDINRLQPGWAIDIDYYNVLKSFMDEIPKDDQVKDFNDFMVVNSSQSDFTGELKKTWYITSMNITIDESGFKRSFELVNTWN